MSKENDKEKFISEVRKAKNSDQVLKTYLIESIDNLRESTTKSSDVANELSKKILWLNIILAVATAIAAFATFWMVFCK